ncbi:condensation domain-containing protein [Catenulispora yoronensis]
MDRVGVEDNFFDLGGDSIISIQVVARARARGLRVTPPQMFEHQTIARLATVAEQDGPADADQGPVLGEYPLSPIQHWFFQRRLPEPAHYNQTLLLEIAERLDPEVLRTAVDALVDHHDVLRSRFYRVGDAWGARIVTGSDDPLWTFEVATSDPDTAADAFIEAKATEAQTGLDLEHGPLIRFVLFDRGASGHLLLVVVHHVVMDGVSSRILLEDLALAYDQAERGQPVRLPAKTTSFPQWSTRLGELANSAEANVEAGYWRTVSGAGRPLPRDRDGVNTIASTRHVRLALSAEQTLRLLHTVPQAYRTQINDVLLTALGTVLTAWSGDPAVLVDVEGHGREDLGADVDVSRTVGWFTSLFPVALAAAPSDADPGIALRRTKEYLRAVPRHGLGYGLLRYLTDTAMTDAIRAEVSFNYLGQFDLASGRSATRFARIDGSIGDSRSSEGLRTHLIEINSQVAAGRLTLDWSYSDQLHDEPTVLALAHGYLAALNTLIDHCCTPGAGGFTPRTSRWPDSTRPPWTPSSNATRPRSRTSTR